MQGYSRQSNVRIVKDDRQIAHIGQGAERDGKDGIRVDIADTEIANIAGVTAVHKRATPIIGL